MFIVLGILIFGVLIAVHELGHFLAARLMGVKVNEFAIGMGPKIFSRQRGETLYALRLLPIGGACVMEGEDEDNEDPRSFNAVSRGRRAVILVAGALFNFVTGVIIVLCLYANPPVSSLDTNVIDYVTAGSAYENVLLPGDKIVKLNGHRVFNREDFEMFLNPQLREIDRVRLEIVRGGERVVFDELLLEGRLLPNRDGEVAVRLGIVMTRAEPGLISTLKYASVRSYNYVRSVGLGLQMIFQGDAGIRDLSGPVGITQIINSVGNATVADAQGEVTLRPLSQRLGAIADLAAMIAINLAVMNLLPIPALDGGRIVGLAVTFAIERVTRRRVNPKYEGYVHAAGLVLLLGLMAVVMVSDIFKIFSR